MNTLRFHGYINYLNDLTATVMKIAILGASGPTGQSLVSQALDAGHEVVALSSISSGEAWSFNAGDAGQQEVIVLHSNPKILSEEHKNLKVCKTFILSTTNIIFNGILKPLMAPGETNAGVFSLFFAQQI